MSVSIGPWDPARESFQKYNDRRNQQQSRELAAKLLPSSRYAIAVEHGQLKDYGGECLLHAYVLCRDCWTRPPGEVDPRAMVLTGEIMCWLVPKNEDVALGAPLSDLIEAVLKHENEKHAA